MTTPAIPQPDAPSPSTSPDPDGLYEVVEGRVVEKPPMGAYEGVIASLLSRLLGNHVEDHRIGKVVVELLFLIDRARDLERRPDLAFVSGERWPVGRRVPRQDAWDVVPDLAVEVISPSNSSDEVLLKLEEYFRAGVRLVWVIHSVTAKVYVHDSPKCVRILAAGDEPDGGGVVPGFHLPVASLFEEGPEPPAVPA